MTTFLRSRTAGALLTAAIVGLTLATAYIHLTLGGLLFTLNGLGYVGLAALIVIGAVAPIALVERFSWFPRLALAGYAAMTIAGYLVMGPYFTLGFIAKGIEVALIAALVIDVDPRLRQPARNGPQRARLARPDRPGSLPPDLRLDPVDPEAGRTSRPASRAPATSRARRSFPQTPVRDARRLALGCPPRKLGCKIDRIRPRRLRRHRLPTQTSLCSTA